MIINTTVVIYLLLTFLSLAVGAVALVMGMNASLELNMGMPADQQHPLKKKADLCVTLLTLGLYMRLALVPLWFLMLERLLPSIPGAMCLFGVHLLKTPDSFIATALKVLLPLVYGFWLVLNAFERKSEALPLTNRTLHSLIPLGGLMLVESFFDCRFIFAVRPNFVVCCNAYLDAPSSAFLQTMSYGGWGWVVAFFIVSFSLVGLSAYLLQNPRNWVSSLLWSVSAATLCAFFLAVNTRLSPLFLSANDHHCVFCVWQNMTDMTMATASIYVGCVATLLYAALRNVTTIPDATATANAYAEKLLQWASGSLLLGNILVAIRLFSTVASR